MGFLNGLFTRKNRDLVRGNSFVINPGTALGGEIIQIQNPIGPRFILTAEHEWDPQMSCVTITATPKTVPQSFLADFLGQTVLHCTLSFTGGNSSFGVPKESPPPPPFGGVQVNTNLSQGIKLDANNALFTLPAALGFQVGFSHTCLAYHHSALHAGTEFGPQYRVNIGYSYGTPKSIQSTYTDLTSYFELGAGPIPVWAQKQQIWAKPLFAEAFSIRIDSNPNTLSGYINVTFYNSSPVAVKTCSYTSFNSFPLIQWPQDADYVMIDVINLSFVPPGAGLIAITPVHAIRL